jgi:hypothetical protein
MSTRQPRKIRRNAAEQLLGGPAGPGAGPEQLARVLAAAAAPGRESELAGEEAAVAAFRAHHLVPVTASRRGQMIKSPLAKLLTAKVLAVCVAVFATGGVALAASDGALSSSQTPRGHGGVSRPASPGGIAPQPTAAASPSSSPVVPGSARDLCRALAGRVDPAGGAASVGRLEQGLASPELSQVLSSPLFSSLVSTAQGGANVPDYCGLLLGLPKLPDPGGLAQLPAPVLSGALVALRAGTLSQVLTSLPAPVLGQVLTALPPVAVSQVLASLPAPGLAQVLTALPSGSLSQVLTSLPAPGLAQVLTALPSGSLSQVLTTLPADGLSGILTRLPAAGLTRVLTALPASARSRILGELPGPVLSQLRSQLPGSLLGQLPGPVPSPLPSTVLPHLPG